MGNSYYQRIIELERLERESAEKEAKDTVRPRVDLQDLNISQIYENSSESDPEFEATTDRMLRRYQQALENRHFHQQLLASQAVLRNRIRQRHENPFRPENTLMDILARYSSDTEMEEV